MGTAWARLAHGVLQIHRSAAGRREFTPGSGRSITLTLPDGTTLTGRDDGSSGTSGDDAYTTGRTSSISVCFKVPDDIRSGTDRFLPAGTFTIHGNAVSSTPYQGGDPRYETHLQHNSFKPKPRDKQ